MLFMWDPLHPEKTVQQIQRYCAFQDRSTHDVMEKLKSLGVPYPRIKSLVMELAEERFIDEERFVRSFVIGKFRQNKWGKIKIAYALKSKGIPESLIREGLENIDEEDYRSALKTLVKRKLSEIKGEKNLNVRQKIINFALGKGFEMALVLEIIKEIKIDP